MLKQNQRFSEAREHRYKSNTVSTTRQRPYVQRPYVGVLRHKHALTHARAPGRSVRGEGTARGGDTHG
eukprot:3302732-Prymnesium_polylepis.1